MRELLHFHTNLHGGVQNPDGEIVSIKIGRTLIHSPYGLDLSSNIENRVSVDRKIMHRSSRHLADFRSRLSGGAWLSPSCCTRFLRLGCGKFSRFGRGKFSRFGGFNRSRQFRLGRFRSAMVAMVQRLDARSFFFRPQLCVCTVSALLLEVFRNRFSCHRRSVAELSPSKLSNFGHSVTIHGPPRGAGDFGGRR